MASCEQNGHIYGHDGACVFCGKAGHENPPHGPVSERFMRHHYGASGVRGSTVHDPINDALRHVKLPTVDADSKRIITALLAELERMEKIANELKVQMLWEARRADKAELLSGNATT